MQKYNITAWSLIAIGICFITLALIEQPSDAEDIAMLTYEQRKEITERNRLHSELVNAITDTNNRLGASVTKYDGPSRNTRPQYRVDRKKIREDLLTAELIEVPR